MRDPVHLASSLPSCGRAVHVVSTDRFVPLCACAFSFSGCCHVIQVMEGVLDTLDSSVCFTQGPYSDTTPTILPRNTRTVGVAQFSITVNIFTTQTQSGQETTQAVSYTDVHSLGSPRTLGFYPCLYLLLVD
jgi:hypothetical protein